MNAGQTIFAELMGQPPWREFQKCVARYCGDAHERGFTYQNQHLATAFTRLTYCDSLRDIDACHGAMCGKHYQMGFRGSVARSTLADANDAHDGASTPALRKR